MKISRLVLLAFMAGLILQAQKLTAQETLKPQVDTLAGDVKKIKADLDILKKIKFSGYVQPQFQWADSAGISSYAGGDFAPYTDNRFKVRRGEFKTMFDNGITQVVANIDITQSGVNVKDAYGRFTEQRYRSLSFTAGIFNRPFGWEVPTSSSVLESPERARMIQILFPGERDGGCMLSFQRPAGMKLNPLKLDLGIFNGSNTANDFDSKKDIIGAIHWLKNNKKETFYYAAGISYYSGGVANGTKYLFHDIGTLGNGNKGFNVDSAIENKNAISQKTLMGGDFQVNIVWKAGTTKIRGEYIQGRQPGTSSSTATPSAKPLTDAYIRDFNGAYFYLIHNILKSKHQVILKYDWYDPNVKAGAGDIGKAGSRLGAADVKYTTIGFGWIYQMNPNVKWTLYYDMVTNETTPNLVPTAKDLKDNVLTIRAQFKF
jgi:phosphate-selective porin